MPSKEELPAPAADFTAELRWWQKATRDQKEAMLARPECEPYRKRMRGNATPGPIFCSVLRKLLASQPQEAATV